MLNLQPNAPFFFDGAFGTYYNILSKKNALCEYANINEQDIVLQIHRAYIDAGVHAIKTNTFAANAQFFADKKQMAGIITQGYDIAIKAAGDAGAHVFADIGAIRAKGESASDEYREIAQIFIGCGASNFIFETQPSLDPLIPALADIKSRVPHATVLVSFAVSQEGYSSSGIHYKVLLNAAAQSGYTDIVGLNCSCGPSHMHTLIKGLDAFAKPLSAMPNAGYPASQNGRTIYQDNAEYFSTRLADIHALGVQVLGGCCGTTPDHIRETIQRIGGSKTVKTAAFAKAAPQPKKAPAGELKQKFSQNRKIIAVELDAPLKPDMEFLVQSARRVLACSADLITIADSPLARSRADSIMVAAKLRRETGADVLPHLSCRDRNHIGIQAALVAGKMEGIENIFAVTGDPISLIDRGEYKGVYHFSACDLISFIRHLNNEIFVDSPYYIGGALNPNATNFSAELVRARQKLANGAEFLLTQPVFSDRAAENLAQAKKELGCNLLAGILPVAGYKNALFLNNEVPGIHIPAVLTEQLQNKTAEEVYEISLEFCMDIVRKTYSSCNGYYIMTPLQKVGMVCGLIQRIRSLG